MRKVILFNLVSLDGFFSGPNGEIDWHNVDDEFNQFAIEQLHSAGGLLFGRKTYQMMESYWPTPQAIQNDPEVAGLMNQLPKVVFSRTLEAANWNNSRLVKGNLPREISRLKQEPGKDLFLFGSAELAADLIQNRLIDEYRLLVNPLVLGRGRPMFQNLQDRLRLNLIQSRTFQNGNVLLIYEPAIPPHE